MPVVVGAVIIVVFVALGTVVALALLWRYENDDE